MYESNANAYLKRLSELDEYASKFFSLSPVKAVLVTAHDAFGYFGKRFGFEAIGLQISTEWKPRFRMSTAS